ncbi:MAG: rhomboid family intramembrane serine protease [Deltaproteobacteria bacterium]|nr:rhomboid family intramembrane serine protease [Deltaproteobacteria bacterium]
MQFTVEGWVLRISSDDYDQAIDAIDIYEEENVNWPPERNKDRPRHGSSPLVLMALFAMALFFFYVTGPVSRGGSWFTHGRADALLLATEPWRMITALTLHADAQHVLGNVISGSIFGAMLSRRIGPGGALFAMLLAGALGNAANALYHLPDGHRSIGASTAIFGAVGLLAAVQLVLDFGQRKKRDRYGVVDFLAPVVGGLALLGALGSGRHSDLGAHGFGFLSGVVLGLGAAWVIRRQDARPSTTLQVVAALSAFAIIGGSWALATLW